jgi:hypothetical protein
MSFTDFLVWLTAGGSIIAVSWLCERWVWFGLQTKELKQYIIFGASTALSIAAHVFITYASPELIVMLSPYFMIISATFVSIFIGQVFFKSMKKESKG